MSDSDCKINLSEVFASIQGEGRYLGTPSIFVRTSGCNLRCQWNGTRCDTPYTSWESANRPVSIAQVGAMVERLRLQYPLIQHLVVTGGEPLLQAHLGALIDALRRPGDYITIETNGTLTQELQADFLSISPKLASSTPEEPKLAAMHGQQRLAPEALDFWISQHDYQFKFVINEAADEAEIDELLGSLDAVVPPDRIYLMPQGIRAEQLAEHGRICVDICLRRGWRYTPRAHIEIYGNQPGT